MKYVILALTIWLGAAAGPETVPLSLKGQIDLPDVNGRIDHFSADLKNQRLFMSALGNHILEVLDIRGRKRLHSIPDLAAGRAV